jgi:asparagine synthase (glutamine-hydrolysing)
MAKAVSGPIHCFTIGFEDPRFDETRYAKMVASRYGVEHEIEVVTERDLEAVRLLPGIFDEPFGDSSALPTYLLSRLARKYVTVALSGDAGDELFAGYRRYAFHGRESAIRRSIPEALRSPVFGLLGRVYPQLDWAPRPLRARQTFKELGASECDGYYFNVSVIDDAERRRLFSQDMRRALGGYHASNVIRHHMERAPCDDAIAIAQYVDLKTWLPGDILTKVDRAAMASSLETRVPMLDHGFVDWALGLPSSLKIANGTGKFLMKRAFERLVPNEVLYRPKQGFSVPLAQWFRGEFGRQFENDLGAQPQWEIEQYFDRSCIIRLLTQHRSGLRDHSRALWLLWMFQSFLQNTHRSESLAKAA